MPFDWNSGQKKSTGFDWDSGKSDDIVMPALPKPKVEMQEAPMTWLMTGIARATPAAEEAFVKPARSVAKGYYEGSAAASHLLANAAKGVENVTGLKHGGAFDDAEAFYRAKARELEGKGASGVAGALYEATGRTPVDLAKYTVATTALGGPLGMAAVDAGEAADKGAKESLIAGAKGAAMGGLLHVTQPAAIPTRVAAMGTAGASEAALAGGSPTDVISSGLTMGAMAIPGGKGIGIREARAAEAKTAADYARMKEVQAERQAAWENPVEGMGVRPMLLGEQPVEIETPYSIALREREALRAAQNQRGAAPVDQATRKAELKSRFRPEPPPEPAGVTEGKPSPLQPLGEPVFKSAKESADAFLQEGPKSAQESASVFRKELNQRPVVPETGVPENILRAQDARERMAQQYADKPWSELSNAERQQIDDWIKEGNQGSIGGDTLTGTSAESVGAGRDVQAPGSRAPRESGTTGIRPTRRRSSGQRGALSVPDFLRNKPTAGQPPIDPSVAQYIEQQKAIRAESKKAAEGSFMDKLRSWRDSYRRTINDTTVPLTDTMQSLDKQAGKAEVPASVRMNDLIDKKLGASKAASRWLRDEGILDAVGRVESLDALDQFMIAQRSAELEAAGFKSGRDLAKDQALIASLSDRIAIPAEKDSPAMTYGQVAKRFTDANNKLLRMAVDSGIINKDVADSLVQKYGNYIPIERIQEAADFAHQHGRGASQVASLARQSILQKLTGSERVIDDSIVSSIHRADKVFSQVARNDAARFLVDGLRQLDNGEGRMVRPKSSGENIPSDRTISAYVDGKRQDFVVPADIAAAAKSLDVKQLGWAMQHLVQPATRLMKLTTTGLSLPFTVINIARDIGHTAVTQKGWAAIGGALDPRIYAKGIKEVFDPNSKSMAALERHGGGFTSFDLSRGQVTPEIELMRAKRGSKEAAKYVAAHPIKTVGAMVRAAENFLGKSEQFGRLRIYESEYRSAIKRGLSAQDAEIMAAHEANNALPNYARAGSVGRVLNAMVPYLNARIQGVRSLTRAIERDPAGTVGKIMAIQTAAAAVAAYNLMDPERRQKYLDMEEYERRSNFIILLPGAEKNAKGRWEGVIKIPIPQGIDSMTDVTRKAVEQQYGQDPVKFNDIAESLVGAFTPVEPSPVSKNVGINIGAGMANAMLPQTIKPTVQSVANFNFYRGQAIEPPHMAELPAGERAYPYTSSTAKALARNVLPAVGLQTSPVKVEAFVNDTLGGGGPMALRALDAVAEKAGLAAPQAEHGGADPISATGQRISTVRGGAIDRKYYDLRKQLQDTIAQQEIDAAKQSTDFSGLDRDTQRELLNKALGKAKSRVQKILKRSHIDQVDGPEKVQFMQEMLDSYKQ